MYQRGNGETRIGGGVGDWSAATSSVPAEDSLRGEAQASHGVGARSEFDAGRRHLEDLSPARCIEHVGAIEKTRKRLTIFAVADKTEVAGGRNVPGEAAHMPALATQRNIKRRACHDRAKDHESAPTLPSSYPLLQAHRYALTCLFADGGAGLSLDGQHAPPVAAGHERAAEAMAVDRSAHRHQPARAEAKSGSGNRACATVPRISLQQSKLLA